MTNNIWYNTVLKKKQKYRTYTFTNSGIDEVFQLDYFKLVGGYDFCDDPSDAVTATEYSDYTLMMIHPDYSNYI